MTLEDFEKVLDRRLALTREVLGARKRSEYATTEDRLHNFKAAAGLLQCEPGEALLGMLVKHWVSVQDTVRGGYYGRPVSQEKLDEKIGDAIAYLILLEAVLLERGS